MNSALEIFWSSGSPNAWRVLLTAELKQIPYQSRLIEFSKQDNKQPAFLEINPRGKVPALRDGDYTLYESLAIMTYLDRKQPEPALFGRTPQEYGRIWRTVCEFECYLRPAWEQMLLPVIFRELPAKTEQVRSQAIIVRGEIVKLEQQIGTHAWLCGDGVSAADLAIYPFLKFLVRVAAKDELRALDLGLLPFESSYPRLAVWMTRVESLPGYERAYPPHWRADDKAKAAQATVPA